MTATCVACDRLALHTNGSVEASEPMCGDCNHCSELIYLGERYAAATRESCERCQAERAIAPASVAAALAESNYLPHVLRSLGLEIDGDIHLRATVYHGDLELAEGDCSVLWSWLEDIACIGAARRAVAS